jgi:hypothetical protein
MALGADRQFNVEARILSLGHWDRQPLPLTVTVSEPESLPVAEGAATGKCSSRGRSPGHWQVRGGALSATAVVPASAAAASSLGRLPEASPPSGGPGTLSPHRELANAAPSPSRWGCQRPRAAGRGHDSDPDRPVVEVRRKLPDRPFATGMTATVAA